MKILISAGGTAEPIDSVRSITNTGTGRLGSLIAEAFAREDRVEEVHYVCDPRAVRPFAAEAAGVRTCGAAGKIREHITHGTQEVLDTMRAILLSEPIGAVIQSMAISDYTTRCVVTAEALAEKLLPVFASPSDDPDGNLDSAMLAEKIVAAMDEAALGKAGKKISSSLSDPLILLKKTPKILPQLKDFKPDIILVGFKLLSSVSREELFSAARHLAETSRCDYVLANDYSTITKDQHTGFLLGADGNVRQFCTKQEIAEGICREVIGRL